MISFVPASSSLWLTVVYPMKILIPNFSDFRSYHLYHIGDSPSALGQRQTTSHYSIQDGDGYEFHLHASHGISRKCCGLSSHRRSCSITRSTVLGCCCDKCGCWILCTITLELLSIGKMGKGVSLGVWQVRGEKREGCNYARSLSFRLEKRHAKEKRNWIYKKKALL